MWRKPEAHLLIPAVEELLPHFCASPSSYFSTPQAVEWRLPHSFSEQKVNVFLFLAEVPIASGSVEFGVFHIHAMSFASITESKHVNNESAVICLFDNTDSKQQQKKVQEMSPETY